MYRTFTVLIADPSISGLKRFPISEYDITPWMVVRDSTEDFVGELPQRAACLLQSSSPPSRRGVEAPPPTVHDSRARTQEALVLHAVQGRVQRAGADVMTVPGQLFGDPGPVDFTPGSMVEHVQLDSTAVERAHEIRL